jgi:hypothetical protein
MDVADKGRRGREWVSILVAFSSKTIEFASWEWLINRGKHPNGGSIILLRSVLTALGVYLAALALRNFIDPTRTWTPSLRELRLQIEETAPWFGTMFAAIYAALYARFASQWTYLANLYNQIKAAECRNDCNEKALAGWKAGFIEDAQELHLCLKPLFASVIQAWAKERAVREAFVDNAPGGEERLALLMSRVDTVWERSAVRSTSARYDNQRLVQPLS